MNILVVGGSGLVGGNLMKVLSANANFKKVVGTHLSHPVGQTVYFNPLEDTPDYINADKWDVIIHTGALTHVDKCEEETELSYDLTVRSTKRLLELSKRNNAKFVYISTDYVFNGKNGPYKEDDIVEPLNIYGKHKLLSEALVNDYQNSLIGRITNVYGDEARDKNFIARIISELANTEMLTVTAPTDQFASPINAYDVARAIGLLIQDNKTGLYHLASTDYVSRVQILQRINKYFDDRIIIIQKSTEQLGQKALRPLIGGLLATKFISEYSDFKFTNMDDYIKTLKYGKPVI